MTRVRLNSELCVRWTESDGSPYEPVFTIRQILCVKGKNSVLIALRIADKSVVSFSE